MKKNNTKITILGCGSSTGVPRVGNEWGVCNPKIIENTQAVFNQDNGTGRVVELNGQGFLHSHGNKIFFQSFGWEDNIPSSKNKPKLLKINNLL